MLYLLYIFIGLLIIFGVNLMITGLLAVHDMYTRRARVRWGRGEDRKSVV